MTSTETAANQDTMAALAQMANYVGHELRNPLAVIQNGIYLLDMMLPDADPDVKETLALVSAEVDEAARIINSLLDFGRSRGKPRMTTSCHHRQTAFQLQSTAGLHPDLTR